MVIYVAEGALVGRIAVLARVLAELTNIVGGSWVIVSNWTAAG